MASLRAAEGRTAGAGPAREPIGSSRGVMQICDSLNVGGLERVAVNLANALRAPAFRSYLCATRADGPLAADIEPHVVRLRLERRGRFDVRAVRRLAAFLRDEKIDILHAHGTALFLAAAAVRFSPGTALVWHDHFGRHETEVRQKWLYRFGVRRAAGVMSVSGALANWSIEKLGVDPSRVWYVPNFVAEARAGAAVDLPGDQRSRIVCVANLRAEKDHETLLEAMEIVSRTVPDAHLLLVGWAADPDREARLRALASSRALDSRVSWLGRRADVAGILQGSAVGVLSSASEGLPLALLEYAAAGLATVATKVGQIPDVLDDGAAGLLVPPRDPEALAAALIRLLRSPEERRRLGDAARTRWAALYSPRAVVSRVAEVYGEVLRPRDVPLAHKTPRLLVVGNFLSAFGGGWGVCESLAAQLARGGRTVITTSRRRGRLGRMADMVGTAWRRRGEYDVAQVDVYSGAAFLWAEAVCWTLRRAGKPYVLTLHGGNLPAFARRWPRRVRRLVHSAGAVTCPSAYLREGLGETRRDIRILPNALEIERYPFRIRKPAAPRIAWLRAYGRTYNPALAVQALALLSERVPAASLAMRGGDRGDGSLEDTRREARRLGVEDRVSIAGAVSKDAVPRFLDGHDIFVNTSDVDNNPVSVLEAMACGLGVVTTDVGGIPFLVEHETSGLLVPAGDPEAMARAVERIVADPELAARLSANARRRAQEADWSAVLPRWEDLLGRLAGGAES